MVKLPRFLRNLKFSSQNRLASMIVFSIDGFIEGLEDKHFTKKSSKKLDELSEAYPFKIEEYEEYSKEYFNDYSNFIKSRYVNIMRDHVGVTGSPLDDAIFAFRIGELKNCDDIFSNKTLKYWDIGHELINDFLPSRCPGFNSIPRE